MQGQGALETKAMPEAAIINLWLRCVCVCTEVCTHAMEAAWANVSGKNPKR